MIPTSVPSRPAGLRPFLAVLVLTFGLLLTVAATVRAQDGDAQWSELFNRPGTNSEVRAVAEWNGSLYVGGIFTEAGGLSANRIARWDGTAWSPLGSGIDDPVSNGVDDLIVYDGALIVAGTFTQAGGTPVRNIARWDGTTWTSLGTGTNDEVAALAVYRGELIAVGAFTEAGGVNANYVARWDGSAWHPLNQGTDGGVGRVTVLGTSLFVAGGFTQAGGQPAHGIARWDGRGWFSVGSYGWNQVLALQGWNGLLVASDIYDGLLAWDGTTWSHLPAPFTTSGYVFSLCLQGTDLVAGGDFPFDTFSVARWNGSSWTGIEGTFSTPVEKVGTYGGALVAGGFFAAVEDQAVYQVALWTGTTWTALGPGKGLDRSVRAFAEYGSDLIGGGEFVYSQGLQGRYVSRWDGAAWHAMGQTNGFGYVYALSTVDTDLYIAGDFGNDTGGPYTCIARWDGASWHPLGDGITPMFPEEPSTVYAVAGYNGGIVAGGSFLYFRPPDTMAYNILKWDGSTWSPFPPVNALMTYGAAVAALRVYQGSLIVAGSFNDGSGPMNNILRWDGTAWSALSQGLNGPVSALAVYNGDLIAGGSFTQAGQTAANNIARWNGTSWSALGTGTNDQVLALAVQDGVLYAGGRFTSAGGSDAQRIARWDGTGWSALGSGITQRPNYEPGPVVYALISHGGSLYVGGSFERAGDKASYFVARWDPETGAAPLAEEGSRAVLRLESGGANPVSGEAARLLYFLPRPEEVSLTVHDVSGRLLATLYKGFQQAGPHDASWTAIGRRGAPVSSGIYLVRLADREGATTLKLVMPRR